MKLKQNLCIDGERLRSEMREITFDMPMLDRERKLKAYYWHKAKCLRCDTKWVEADGY